MGVVRAKSNSDESVNTGTRSSLEYLNLLSLLNMVDINTLTDNEKSEMAHKIGVSKFFYDKGDIDTAYTLLKIEYEHVRADEGSSLMEKVTDKVGSLKEDLRKDKFFPMYIVFSVFTLSVFLFSGPSKNERVPVKPVTTQESMTQIPLGVEIKNAEKKLDEIRKLPPPQLDTMEVAPLILPPVDVNPSLLKEIEKLPPIHPDIVGVKDQVKDISKESEKVQEK